MHKAGKNIKKNE